MFWYSPKQLITRSERADLYTSKRIVPAQFENQWIVWDIIADETSAAFDSPEVSDCSVIQLKTRGLRKQLRQHGTRSMHYVA